MTFSATSRRGSSCRARKTVAMPPSPSCDSIVNAPITEPCPRSAVERRRDGEARVARPRPVRGRAAGPRLRAALRLRGRLGLLGPATAVGALPYSFGVVSIGPVSGPSVSPVARLAASGTGSGVVWGRCTIDSRRRRIRGP